MRRLSISMVLFWILTALPLGAQRTPKLMALADGDVRLCKLTSELLQARLEQIGGKGSREVFARYASQAMRRDKLQCIVGGTKITDELVSACLALKLEVVGRYSRAGLHQIVVRCSDVRQLVGLAARGDVRGITAEPKTSLQSGIATSQGDGLVHCDLVRNLYGADGSGLRVGVLSDSIHDVLGGSISQGILKGSASQLSQDLPESIRVVDAGPGGGSDEGAAMAEIIHDLAPGAEISFASAYTSYAAFASNVTALRNDPGFACDILCDDVLWFAEPVYQNGPIALACNESYAAGVAYFSSAGNSADRAHERTFRDTSASTSLAWPPSGEDLHDFGLAYGRSSKTHLGVHLPSGGQLVAVLHWDEPYGGVLAQGAGSQSDLDLYLASDTQLPLRVSAPNPNVLSFSASEQGTVGAPAGEPYEILGYVNTTGASQMVYVVIDHYKGRTPVLLHLALFGDGRVADYPLLADRTVYGHCAAENVQATAAIFFDEIATQGRTVEPPEQLNVESYSSKGGTLAFWFDDQGNRLEKPRYCFKPELTAPDGTNTSFFGVDTIYDEDSLPNFYGTSAAAPHAAAVAALVLSANPSLAPAQLYYHLRTTAIDAEDPGPDALSGYGLVDAQRALAAVALDKWDHLDDQMEKASPLSPPRADEQVGEPHSLSGLDPRDWFALSVPAGKTCRIDARASLGECAMTLYEPNGATFEPVAVGDSAQPLFYTPAQEARLYLEVSPRVPQNPGCVYTLAWRLATTFQPNIDDSFETNDLQPPGAASGWSPFGMDKAQLGLTDYDELWGAYRANVASDPTARHFRVAGAIANQSEWLPYAAVGKENFVRAKYYVYGGLAPGASELNTLPNLRLRLQTRFGVNSMLEVFGHTNDSASQSLLEQEIRPSTDPSRPSLYMVDFDPVDVPYLVQNGQSEGIQRAFEAYAIYPQDRGYMALSESVLGIYPAAVVGERPVATKLYSPSTSDAGDLKVVNSATDLFIYNLRPGTSQGEFGARDMVDTGSYAEGSFGVTLDTQRVSGEKIGLVVREFDPGTSNGLRVRVEPKKLYKIRWHVTSTQLVNRQAQLRLRARTLKFSWTQKYEVGGAWGTGGQSYPLGANNAIAQQALAGVGCLNPDKNAQEPGGWYTMLFHTPMNPDVRPEFAPETALQLRMPNISAEPGPGEEAASRRDLRLGCELVDTLSQGAGKDTEAGNFTIDAIRVDSYTLAEQ